MKALDFNQPLTLEQALKSIQRETVGRTSKEYLNRKGGSGDHTKLESSNLVMSLKHHLSAHTKRHLIQQVKPHQLIPSKANVNHHHNLTYIMRSQYDALPNS